MYTVLIADDQRLFRAIAKSMLQSTTEFQVTCEAADGAGAIYAYES